MPTPRVDGHLPPIADLADRAFERGAELDLADPPVLAAASYRRCGSSIDHDSFNDIGANAQETRAGTGHRLRW